jgi:hypothetical protein
VAGVALARARKQRTMHRGAFTLLETMIVVLIVAAISAIFLPSIAARVTDGKLGHASRSIEAGAAIAAAEAMEGGTIIAYVAEKWGDDWVLWAEEVAPAEIGELLRPTDAGLDVPPDERETTRTELASFEGVGLTDLLPPAPDALIGPSALGGTGEDFSVNSGIDDTFDAGWGERERFVLAVFFADGSCRAGPTMYLVADDGERESIHIRPLTGRVRVRRLPSIDEELGQLESGEDTDPLPPIADDPLPVPGGGP